MGRRRAQVERGLIITGVIIFIAEAPRVRVRVCLSYALLLSSSSSVDVRANSIISPSDHSLTSI